MVRSRKESKKDGTKAQSPAPTKKPYEGINETSVEQDYNGRWYVLNYDGYPISPGFDEEGAAVMWKRNLI